jgi:hypothetical protein
VVTTNAARACRRTAEHIADSEKGGNCGSDYFVTHACPQPTRSASLLHL